MKGLRPGFPGNLQVLVVDGAELESQLKELGYAATLCSSAREAALSLSRGQSTPDVLLAEARSVHVGDADSQWLLGQARARNLPLVLMSATGGAGEVMKGIELGAVDYLEKPVSLPKLRNIWQHVVRKVMQVTVQEKPVAFSMPKVQAQPAAPLENAASVAETVFTAPSPCASADCGAPSGLTSHSTKYASEAEASSCSENTKCRRVLRSADTCAESAGGKASTSDGCSQGSAPVASAAVPNKPSKLSRASSSSTSTRARSKRSAPARSKSDASLQQQDQPPQPATGGAPPALVTPPAPAAAGYPVCSSLPAAGAVPWQPGCTWGAPVSPMPIGWQPVSLPASFMPVDSLPMATGVDSGKGASRPPASLPSITSFASALSCNTELDLPFPSAGDLSAMNVAAVSPSFGSSDTSLHSDFTDLVLPNDLDLDLMFGDGLDGLGLFGAADALTVCGPAPSPADRPPIGLALRKTQSLVDLINAQLSAQQQQQPGEAKCAAGAAPMQCA